ncbi:MAG: SH3 domain-containing protein [Lachnospiraceae bacterium]|jgi:hypothetical protein
MLDDFREWLSDNLRYILLGLTILVVLLVLYFGVKGIAGLLKEDEDKEPDKVTEQDVSDNEEDADNSEKEPIDDTNPLEKNAYPELNAVIETFYTAWGNKDINSMKSVTDSFDATDEAKVLNSTYIESYNNINTYTKKGLTDGSYVVFVSYELKFVDIDTPAPGLTQVYVETDSNGKFYIHTDDEEPEIQTYVEKVTQDADVQELISTVQQAYQDAQNSDEELRQFQEQLGEASNMATEAADGSVLTVQENCFVRETPGTDGEVLGSLEAGDTITKVTNAADGWIQVDYNGSTGYVRGDLLR